jgi:hypothetical protein
MEGKKKLNDRRRRPSALFGLVHLFVVGFDEAFFF